MATNFAIAANPTTVSPGGTSALTVSCTLSPGGPVTVTLDKGTTQEATDTITIPAEQFPSIKIAGDPTIGPNDYVLSTTQGTLSAGAGQGAFTLQL